MVGIKLAVLELRTPIAWQAVDDHDSSPVSSACRYSPASAAVGLGGGVGVCLRLRVSPAAADSQDEFEQVLKENFPGSYMLYTSLSGDARSRVFKEYKRNANDPGIGRFSKVIAKILELTIEEEQGSRSKPQQKKHS